MLKPTHAKKLSYDAQPVLLEKRQRNKQGQARANDLTPSVTNDTHETQPAEPVAKEEVEGLDDRRIVSRSNELLSSSYTNRRAGKGSSEYRRKRRQIEQVKRAFDVVFEPSVNIVDDAGAVKGHGSQLPTEL